MSPIHPGAVIAGKYCLERPLARGGMGTVWVARHLQLDMLVAVKFMEGQGGPGGQAGAPLDDGRSRFEREARAAAQIQSQHVVQIHDYGVHEGTPYMAMELLTGEDLGARLHRLRRLSIPALAAILTQLCKALRKAHEAGIVHRDLKPANVFLAHDDDGDLVKVLDFGVAKVMGLGEAGDMTQTGVVVGSVHYMSPEQARGTRAIDQRSDLWSVGVIAYRALTGHLPFAGSQVGDVIVKICSEPMAPPSAHRPDLGPAVDAFFSRALARRPEDRFQTARDLGVAFAALAGPALDSPSASFQARAMLASLPEIPRDLGAPPQTSPAEGSGPRVAGPTGTFTPPSGGFTAPSGGFSAPSGAFSAPSGAFSAPAPPYASGPLPVALGSGAVPIGPSGVTGPSMSAPLAQSAPAHTAVEAPAPWLPPSGTITRASNASDVPAAVPPGRGAGTGTVIAVAVACGVVLATAGTFFVRAAGGKAAAVPEVSAVPERSAPPVVAPPVAPPVVTAQQAASATAAASASSTASAPASAGSPPEATPKATAAPKGGKAKKVNPVLGI